MARNLTFHPYKQPQCHHGVITRNTLVGPVGSGSTKPFSRSVDGETSTIAPRLPFQTAIEPDRDSISRFYDEDSLGMRTLGNKVQLDSDCWRSKPKKVVSVPGPGEASGNCFWEALQRELFLGGSSTGRHSCKTMSSRRRPVYINYKQATLGY
jgi:hypothetical protein